MLCCLIILILLQTRWDPRQEPGSHLDTNTLPPAAAAGEQAPRRTASPANKPIARLHQVLDPPVPTTKPQGNKPEPAGGWPRRKGPAPGASVLSVARQGLGSSRLLSVAAQPSGASALSVPGGGSWASEEGLRLKLQEAGAAVCDRMEEAWPQQSRNSPRC